MDRIDKRILNLLQKDNRISNQKLAETVGLSAPACLKRVKKLRESGVIMADVSIVSPQVVGHLINVIVEVEMDRDTLDVYDSFNRQMSACPEVTQCYQVTGEVDFVLVVLVPDMQAYEAFARRELANNHYLRKFRSLISLRREKFRTAIEL
ncbi:Lrp/AsnC family transcriptional regulator [Oceanospirillum sp.]|uniref:Lrp/AsnC family transcriptional regulator n=1 Tax=Oceanospirillum sp. TaxID=2021254 RepID=UPI003A95151A